MPVTTPAPIQSQKTACFTPRCRFPTSTETARNPITVSKATADAPSIRSRNMGHKGYHLLSGLSRGNGMLGTVSKPLSFKKNLGGRIPSGRRTAGLRPGRSLAIDLEGNEVRDRSTPPGSLGSAEMRPRSAARGITTCSRDYGPFSVFLSLRLWVGRATFIGGKPRLIRQVDRRLECGRQLRACGGR